MWKYLIFTLSESTLRAGWLSWVGVSSSSSRTAKKSLLAKVSNCIGLSSLFSERWPSLSYYTRARASLLRLLPSTKARKACFLELVRLLDVALGCWNWAGRLAARLSHQHGHRGRARRYVLLGTKKAEGQPPSLRPSQSRPAFARLLLPLHLHFAIQGHF